MTTLAMILGCFGTSTALAQAGKGKEKPSKKVDIGGLEQSLVSIGPSLTPEEVVPKLIKGKTTLDEVLLLLGAPMQLNMYGEGGRMAMYMWRSEFRMNRPNYGKIMGRAALGPFGIIGSGRRLEQAQQAADEMRNSIKMLTANFGPDGILKDFMVNPPIMPAKPAPPSNLKVVTPSEKAKSTTSSTTGKTPDAPLVAATPPP